MSCVTITFGDVCENHVRMQKLGQLATNGFSLSDLENAKFTGCEMVDLKDLLSDEDKKNAGDAFILIIRGGVEQMGVNPDDLFSEMKNLDWDKKAFMYGRVVNKLARWNLCFSDAEGGQEPDYSSGKGRVVAFSELTLLKKVKEEIESRIENSDGLCAEGNYYYDSKKCGIGYHGDSERRKVVAVRLGSKMDICYQWFLKSEKVGKNFRTTLNHGDIYVMSEKAVGFDWKKKNILTLRHAAGADKYTKL